MGGHSLLTVKLAHEISEQMGKTIEVKDIFVNPTISDLAEHLNQHRINDSLNALVNLSTVDAKLGDLYCIPGAGGVSASFSNLAEVAKGLFNVKVFEHRGIMDGQRPYLTISQTVHALITELLQDNSTGPFYIAGHSYGGIIAFEAAEALRQRQYDAHLILLDTYLFTEALQVNVSVDNEQEMLMQMLKKQYLTHIQSVAHNSDSSAEFDTLVDGYMANIAEVYAVQSNLAQDYLPRVRIDNDILFLFAAESNETMRNTQQFSNLQGLTDGDVLSYEIAGDHYLMLATSAVNDIVSHLKSFVASRGKYQ